MAPVALVVAAGVTAMGQIQEGNAAEAAGKFSARQNERNAKNTMAEGIRAANETRRQGEQVKSDAAAAMAAGGGVTDDVGAIETLSDIEQITDYNALSAIYQGGVKADQQKMQAQMDRFTGQQRKDASRIKAAGTMLGGASDAYTMGSK